MERNLSKMKSRSDVQIKLDYTTIENVENYIYFFHILKLSRQNQIVDIKLKTMEHIILGITLRQIKM